MQYRFIAFTLILCAAISCKKPVEVPEIPAIIPIPVSQTLQEGSFTLSNATNLRYDDRFEIAATFLDNYLFEGSRIKLSSRKSKNNFIEFVYDGNIRNLEGYQLIVAPRNITIKASNDRGAFYAVQTLRQLLDPQFENPNKIKTYVDIQAITITDAPVFAYRGMHLDVSRHLFPVSFIKEYIDNLAMLKLNTFHWHLTDDQGWRIEIKAFPKLQEIAAFREQTLLGHYNDYPQDFDCTPYGGFYTQAEIKEIVAYATARHIEVIPEIEMPGHATAAIAAYPELGCTGNVTNVATTWGVFEDVYCPNDQTFEFLETVIEEVAALFPGKYIHIGGDEVPKAQWKKCAHCQKLISDKKLKDVNGLEQYFVKRMACFINNQGKQVIGWDEILNDNLPANTTIMSWRSDDIAVQAAKMGYQVIRTPQSHTYFDYYQHDGDDEPLAIGGYLPLEKVYQFNVIPKGLNKQDAKNIIGAQANLWTEYITTPEQVEYMLFPRILALSEVLWSQEKLRNYSDFTDRVAHMHEKLNQKGINYANHLYTINGKVKNGKEGVTYAMSNSNKNIDIRYTTDGNQPDITSMLYKKPIPISKSVTLHALSFKDSLVIGKPFIQDINLHKAVGAAINLNVGPNEAYKGSGITSLINGISGSDKRYGDAEWLGFWGSDVIIDLDLKKSEKLSTITTRFNNGRGQWIYAPRLIQVFYDNETTYQTINIPESTDYLVPITIPVNRNARHIKIKVFNYGTIPASMQGAGNAAWTFIDEIKVN